MWSIMVLIHFCLRGTIMLINRETDYALRILRSLSDKSPQKMQDISEDQHIPSQYIYKITKKLFNAGYVEIKQGRTGGCYIVCDLSEVTLLDIMKATGDDLVINACMSKDFDCTWKDKKDSVCTVHNHLQTLDATLRNCLSSVTISKLMQ